MLQLSVQRFCVDGLQALRCPGLQTLAAKAERNVQEQIVAS